MPEPIGRSNSIPTEHYDYDRELCVGTSAEAASAAEPARSQPARTLGTKGCNSEATQAGIICARALAGAIEVAPTLVGGLVAAFLGGVTCGLAVMEWQECRAAAARKAP